MLSIELYEPCALPLSPLKSNEWLKTSATAELLVHYREN